MGQVVFHLSPVLRDAFISSDLGDATAADLRFPYPDSYLHVGSDRGLMFNEGAAHLEGVFIKHREDQSLMMTLVGDLVDSPSHWGLRGKESFTFFFSDKEMSLPILDAARLHLERQAIDPLADESLNKLNDFDANDQAQIRDAWTTQSEARRLEGGNIPVVLECVRLVANAMLYLNAYPEDIQDGFQDGFPAGFKEKIERSEGKTRERTVSRARSAGFTLIKRVGAVFERSVSSGAGESPIPHLRRAHWRRQAHGPGLTLRKLLWIHSTKVLSGTSRERPYRIVGGAAAQQDVGVIDA